ncbi:hypothetical protein C1T17_17490 [Sphingobium sp. SCG-1]|uniref:acyltransferase family protein n=1 Tax=Sphingobium sp. SCG-1 TaxID=2072936 RepID=UPI000CD67567|nr:acyltransferase [Sphingobium sp. SCG-1]AUW59608.1 hypothetical protein C1T17_17490 [Sphingobium sp. SCG-1]
MNSTSGDKPTVSSSGGKLLTLEAGRFFAAVAVLLYHLTTIVANFRGVLVLGDVFRPGHVGVPFFFVLSGFIIFHVHRRDIGQPRTLGRFAFRRFVRIYPMFWLISLAMLGAFLIVPSFAGQRSLGIGGLLSDFLLLPHGDAILAISWTLRHEIVFYGLFSLAICFGPRAFWALALWIAVSFWLSLLFPAGEQDLGGWSVMAASLNLGFAFGMIAAALLQRPSIAPAWLWVALGGGSLALLCVLEWSLGHHVDHSVQVLGPLGDIGYLLASAILIYGLAKGEENWRLPYPKLWKILGGSSYLIYLIHQPVASVAMRLLRRFDALPPEGAFAICAALAIGVAVLLHLTVERWLLRKLNSAAVPTAKTFPAAI